MENHEEYELTPQTPEEESVPAEEIVSMEAEPVCPEEIIPEENKVILGELKSLERTEMRLKSWNIVSPEMLLDRDDVIVKIRYRKQANRCTVSLLPDQTLLVKLHEPLTAIASGQAAAFYNGNRVLGGGIII